uniref:DNA repair protein RecN n=1 Tax=Candidatus Kentrum sp. TC TaxID=2126339 RepID=A0A450YJH0_9GAMM|nr:MAG: DNA replication and repair protein RecN [Candidatus Kentron sp. TC]VFK41680.1 MAG: DNA repair protein RecN (Recombination protein N) [Candidatus Kentron sp. TC]VFK53809.1 MAG: DNA repair protein RecN (Recombination protein N) [Candidatus Kentron sp. TC]
MLVHLIVRDFVIVDRLELAIQPGMTVMTGETGAGKSILVDALGLTLGERANGVVVRAGCKRAEIIAVFDISRQPDVREWLREQAIDSEECECILRRSISADGRARAFINGRPAPLQLLRELGDRLVDIHGQHAHQSLLKNSVQRDIVDAYGGNDSYRKEIAELYAESKEKNRELRHYAGESGEENDARLEWLRFQVEEIEGLNLEPDEMDALDEEHRRLGHGAEIISACQGILDQIGLDSDDAVLGRIDTSLRALHGLCSYDRRLEDIYTLFDTAIIHLKEGAGTLRQYASGLGVDEERLRWVEARLASIHDLARKHRVPPDGLAKLAEELREEIIRIEQSATLITELHRQLAALKEQYRVLASRLRERRIDAGAKLSAEVTKNLQRLGMPGGKLEISVLPRDDEHPMPSGLDEVVYKVSTNPGQSAKPLTQVVSGGELSRIALAIQVIVSEDTGTPTLIFDEVDAGIGGQVAEIVGRHLRHLGRTRQVLCITHLPQVASQAHHHLKVQKCADEDSTQISLASLNEPGRIREIARMMGGVRITAKTRAYAREMLGNNENE